MPPNPQSPEEWAQKIEHARALQRANEAEKLARINADRASRGEAPLTELPQIETSHESGRLRPSTTPAVRTVLRPEGKTGAAWSGMDDDKPEIVQVAPGIFKQAEE